MEVDSAFDGEIRERLERLERTVAELGSRMDSRGASAEPARPSQQPPRSSPRPSATSFKAPLAPAPSRGADWWLARAGAALTVLALILLYQYAIGRGWITPVVRVFTGTAIGAALMYWGRKLAPAETDAAFPVALRELMMGSALAAWYVSAYAASALYHLISIPAARFAYLVLSIAGGLIALNERRSLLAIIAIGTGFATPILLSSPTGSIPAYALFLAVLGGLSIYLYLMRGWQSVLWIAFLSMWGSINAALGMLTGAHGAVGGGIPQGILGSGRVSLSILTVVMSYSFFRTPLMRRKLLATGSDRYVEPIRSLAAQSWLRDAGGFFKYFSPNAGAADSLSVWVIAIAAPLVGISLLSATWILGGYVWGALAIVAAAFAGRRFTSGAESDLEVRDVLCAATVVWSLAGFIAIARELAQSAGLDVVAIPLGIVAVYSILIVTLLAPARFFTAIAVGRVLAALAIVTVVFSEVSALGGGRPDDRLKLSIAFGIAEVLAMLAALAAAREMSKGSSVKPAAVALALSAYAAFILFDARVLGAVWSPLVTATYAIAGTVLLMRGRKSQSKIMQSAGGATVALVIGRLLFVDLVGVDTIWRVLLFLGCGALFLFTSYQIQNASRQTPPDAA